MTARNPVMRTPRTNGASELPTRMESTSARGTTTRQLSQSSGRGKGIPRSESARTTSPYMRDTCPARQIWAIWCRGSTRESSTGIRRHPLKHALSRNVTARHPATARFIMVGISFAAPRTYDSRLVASRRRAVSRASGARGRAGARAGGQRRGAAGAAHRRLRRPAGAAGSAESLRVPYSLFTATRVSTWQVCGNMSYARTSVRRSGVAPRRARSRASVAGSHET